MFQWCVLLYTNCCSLVFVGSRVCLLSWKFDFFLCIVPLPPAVKFMMNKRPVMLMFSKLWWKFDVVCSLNSRKILSKLIFILTFHVDENDKIDDLVMWHRYVAYIINNCFIRFILDVYTQWFIHKFGVWWQSCMAEFVLKKKLCNCSQF